MHPPRQKEIKKKNTHTDFEDTMSKFVCDLRFSVNQQPKSVDD